MVHHSGISNITDRNFIGTKYFKSHAISKIQLLIMVALIIGGVALGTYSTLNLGNNNASGTQSKSSTNTSSSSIFPVGTSSTFSSTSQTSSSSQASITTSISTTTLFSSASTTTTTTNNNLIDVTRLNSSYKLANTSPTTGWFANGQSADIMLEGFGFNNSGGALQFNHPGQIATDGTHLAMADTWNNRVLLWNTIPSGNNVPADIVLGQPSFATNDPGNAMNQMNWPVGVSISADKLVVADTYNNRILIWNSIPTKSGQAADIQIDDAYQTGPNLGTAALRDIHWPWGVWTDGTKLVLTSTSRGVILIWNSFPTQTNQSADIYIYGGGIGTPRTITSDGTHLIIGDHNGCLQNSGVQATNWYPLSCSAPTVSTTWFWRSFPTHDNQLPDFYMNEPTNTTWMTGQFTSDGKLFLMGTLLYELNAFPSSGTVLPDLEVGSWYIPGLTSKYMFTDPFSLATAGSKVFVSESFGNKILVYNSYPTAPNQFPDSVIGAPDINANTLQSHFMLGNALPATDGKSLVVVSDADYMYIWKNIPDQSGAEPDVVFNFHTLMLAFSPECVIIHNGTLVVAGLNGDTNGPQVFVWNQIPVNGQLPDRNYSSIGGVKFSWIHGCSWDGKYFFLSDYNSNLVYVWNTLPAGSSGTPLFTLPASQATRLSSDGIHLVVSSGLGLYVYNESGLDQNSKPVTIGGAGVSNGLRGLVYGGHLFAVDTGFNRLQIWDNISQAMNGGVANVTIGCTQDTLYCGSHSTIGKSGLFWPYSLTSDGHYLWVGETKFSNRLLRFSIQPSISAPQVPTGPTGMTKIGEQGMLFTSNYLLMPVERTFSNDRNDSL